MFYNDYEDEDVKIKAKRKIERYRKNLTKIQMDKWFELFVNSGRFPELDDEQNQFAMVQFWEKGSFAVWKDKAENLALAPFGSSARFNRYLAPTKITLVRLGDNDAYTPTGQLTVNKDAVIIWYSPNHMPLRPLIETYVDRIVQIEMIINSNLIVQNMPFILKGDKCEIKRLRELVSQILNGELVITADVNEIENLQVLSTNVNLIINDLYSYKKDLENELLTYLGFNNISFEKKERLITDEANANNDYIEASDDVHTDEINRGCKRVTEYLRNKLSYVSKFDELEAKNKAKQEEGGDEDVDGSNDSE